MKKLTEALEVFKKFDIDVLKMSIRYKVLTATEFRILLQLIAEPDRIFTRAELLLLICPDNYRMAERGIDIHIKRIRDKLNGANGSAVIETIHGTGYRLSPYYIKYLNEKNQRNNYEDQGVVVDHKSIGIM